MKKILINIKNKFKKLTLKRVIVYICTLILASLFIFYGTTIKYTTDDTQKELHNQFTLVEYTKMKVLEKVDEWEIESINPDTKEAYISEKGYVYYCKILDGENKGSYTYVVQTLSNYIATYVNETTINSTIYCRKLAASSTLTTNADESIKSLIEYNLSSSTYSFDHTTTLIWLLIIFVFLVLFLSRSKGISTIIALSFSIASILFVYIPAILSGMNIYFWTLIICVFSICVTLLLIEGITKKMIAATCGCFLGLAVSSILCIISNKTMNIIGINEDIGDAQSQLVTTYYYIFNCIKTLDLRGLIFSAVTIGALGAIMDVAMSLSSALYEVYINSNNNSFKNTFKSGLTIGKDMLGTMSNTLVLAYISTSLVNVLFYVVNYYPTLIVRKEFFAIPIAQALIGSIGILVTIPLTSLICALLYNKKQTNIDLKKESN